MPTEYAGVLAVPLIVGLVEVAKRFGLNTVWAAPLAVVLGMVLAVGLGAGDGVSGCPAVDPGGALGVGIGVEREWVV